MNEQDRIREQECGCRYDSITVIFTNFCYWHDNPQRAINEWLPRENQIEEGRMEEDE